MSLSLTLDILNKYNYNKTLVETGTFTGGTITLALLSGFEDVRSVEIFPDFYNAVKKQYKNDPRVKLWLGDAEVLLWDMIKDIEHEITFFLDSHVVLQTGNMKGIREIPLLQELDTINKHPIKSHTIMIDDRRMMGYREHPGGWISHEWEGILEDMVMEKLRLINPDYKYFYEDTVNGKQDIIVATLR